MKGWGARLAGRARSTAPAVVPVLPSRFEPRVALGASEVGDPELVQTSATNRLDHGLPFEPPLVEHRAATSPPTPRSAPTAYTAPSAGAREIEQGDTEPPGVVSPRPSVASW